MDFLRPLIVAIAFGVGFYFAGQTVYWLFRYLTLGMTDKRTRLHFSRGPSPTKLGEFLWAFLLTVFGVLAQTRPRPPKRF